MAVTWIHTGHTSNKIAARGERITVFRDACLNLDSVGVGEIAAGDHGVAVVEREGDRPMLGPYAQYGQGRAWGVWLLGVDEKSGAGFGLGGQFGGDFNGAGDLGVARSGGCWGTSRRGLVGAVRRRGLTGSGVGRCHNAWLVEGVGHVRYLVTRD